MFLAEPLGEDAECWPWLEALGRSLRWAGRFMCFFVERHRTCSPRRFHGLGYGIVVLAGLFDHGEGAIAIGGESKLILRIECGGTRAVADGRSCNHFPGVSIRNRHHFAVTNRE